MLISSIANSSVGVLLIGHGTRDQKGLAECAEVARQTAKSLSPAPVELAFLELATPTIQAAVDQLVDRGVRQVIVSPLLLFAAGHAKQDIPAAVAAAVQRYDGVEWWQAEHLGCHPVLVELSALRFLEAVDRDTKNVSHCRLILVGRGSHDAEAIREMLDYSRLLSDRIGVPDIQISFLAMAQPRLRDVLGEAASATGSLIVVQPHLLFHGELLGQVQQEVGDWQSRTPDKQWRIAGHLGPAVEVVAALVDRCEQAPWSATMHRRF
jgi:sirohydrochlorin cobaltochelatase